MGMRARTLHETGSWPAITDGSNAFNTVKRTAVLAEVTICVPTVTPLMAMSYNTRLADVFFGWAPGRPGRSLAPAVFSRGPHGSGNVLPGVVTGAEAVQRGV